VLVFSSNATIWEDESSVYFKEAEAVRGIKSLSGT